MIWDDFKRLSIDMSERNDTDSATIKLLRLGLIRDKHTLQLPRRR
jgi:hypothetical protein